MNNITKEELISKIDEELDNINLQKNRLDELFKKLRNIKYGLFYEEDLTDLEITEIYKDFNSILLGID